MGNGMIVRQFRIGLKEVLVAGSLTVGLVGFAGAASADDSGIAGFFSRQFGIDFNAAPQQPSYDDVPEDRPLIVRPHRRKTVARRVDSPVMIGPVAPVTIYQDRTLRPGDAVMTDKGLRVFVGNRALPHTDADFTSVADVDGLTPQVQKALDAIDKAPRG